MPGYRTHTTTNLLALGGLYYLAAVNYEQDTSLLLTGAASFAVATFLLSPDLDLKHSSPTKNWGLLRWLWRPYQLMFKHRGLSHSLLFSSATRITYLTIIACVSAYGLHAVGVFSPDRVPMGSFLGEHSATITAAGVGLVLSDTCHIVTDRICTLAKTAGKILFW